MDPSHKCSWYSTPLGGAHSHQVRVPDDALQSPRVHDARTRRCEGYRHVICSDASMTQIVFLENNLATSLGSPLTRYLRVQVFKSPEKGCAVGHRYEVL